MDKDILLISTIKIVLEIPSFFSICLFANLLVTLLFSILSNMDSGTWPVSVGGLEKTNLSGKSPFDLIISNPPYIPSSSIGTLPREIAEFEPRIALDGGPDGLQFIGKIVMESRSFLKDGGWLMLELGEGQGDAIAGMIRNAGFFESPSITKDYSGADRVIRARKGPGGCDERGVSFG